jgi:hypothetical protein
MMPKCSCGGVFVHPSELGFDSDGSVLVCNGFKRGKACTNSILTVDSQRIAREQRRVRTRKQERQIQSMIIASQVLVVIMLFFGASLWLALSYIPLAIWDVIMIKGILKRRKESQP